MSEYDALRALLEPPIAFHRSFVRLTESVTAALFLSQCCYWSKITKFDWFYKTRDEWTEETGLTRREQESARSILRELQILDEKREGIPARIYYRINLPSLQAGLHQTAQLDGAKPPNCAHENAQPYKEAETTQETTSFLLTPPSEGSGNGDSSPKKNGKVADSRFSECKRAVFAFYRSLKGNDPYWTGKDSGQLSLLLKENPDLRPIDLAYWLQDYGRSEGINVDLKPYEFLPRLHRYASGPLDKYGKPLKENV